MPRLDYCFVAIAGAAALAGACTASAHQITDQEYDDLADHVGATTANPSGGEVGSMRDALTLAAGGMPFGLAIDANGHVGGARFGVTFDYDVACTDAAGVAQPACDASTVAADIELAWTGTLAAPDLDASVDRQGQWRLTDLTTAPRLDGDASFSFDSEVSSSFHPNAETTYHLQYQATYDAVVFDASHVPTAGTIHYMITAVHTSANASGTSQDSFDVDAVLTFGPGGTAQLVLDGDRSYTVDLTTGLVVKAGA